MTNGIALEIPATLGAKATRLRTVIVPDLAFFGIGDGLHPDWTVGGIGEVMRWCDLRPRVSFNPALIVAAPNHGYHQYTAPVFAVAWEKWMQSAHRMYGTLALEMTHNRGDGSLSQTNRFWWSPGSESVAQFYSKEFIDRAQVDPHVDPWWHIINMALPCSLHSWFSDPDVPILERFARGDVSIEVDLFDDPADDQIGEVLVLDRTPAGEVTARAFMIPRVWDPGGHLP
jgi:hypothetical protein